MNRGLIDLYGMQQYTHAVEFAFNAHEGQVDKGGNPYKYHLSAVAENPSVRSEGYLMQAAAVLHDVLEDTDVTVDNLREEGFSDFIIGTVDFLTRKESESYKDYIIRCKDHHFARIIKIADMEDNMDVRRMSTMDDDYVSLLKRYQRAYRYISSESEEY